MANTVEYEPDDGLFGAVGTTISATHTSERKEGKKWAKDMDRVRDKR